MSSVNETNDNTIGSQILKTHGVNIDKTLRQDIVNRVKSGAISVNEASDFYGVFPSIIKLWAYGRNSAQSKHTRPVKSSGYNTPKDFRTKLAKEIAEGRHTVESASDFHNIKKSTIQRWCDSYNYQNGIKAKAEVRRLIQDSPRMSTIVECVRIARGNPEIAGAILLKAASANRQIAELISAMSKTL
jgi:transposase-like protein